MRIHLARPDAGFSLVEVLVALIVTSGLVLGIGALTGSVGSLGVRGSAAEAMLNAMIDVDIVRRAIGQAEPERLVAAGSDGFDLSPGIIVDLFRSEAGNVLLLNQPSAVARVDLSVFDAASLEYLGPARLVPWSAQVDDLAATAGVRLVLVRGARVWRPLVWLRDRYLP